MVNGSQKVGISDIAIYVPEARMEMAELVRHRLATLPHLERHYERAVRTTGQRAIRFPGPFEDTATLAAQAALKLLRNGRLRNPAGLRYLIAGTETPLDHSKPVSAYVQGMLERAHMPIPSSLASFQVQHACAGGTLAVMSAAGLLAVSPRRGESALVVAADIARYEGKSTAEVTQGSGAAALLIEKDPALVELDIANMGYSSNDVDDFFRPLGSTTAKVKGQYSMQCYRESLEGALRDFAERNGRSVPEVLDETDYFVLHAPFRNMPAIALEKIMARELSISPEQTRARLAASGMDESLEVVADVGNTYTASLYITLASLLQTRFMAEGEAIIGKSILLCSYGSGNTMVVMEGRVASRAVEVISSWPVPLVDSGRPCTTREYELWMNVPYLGVHDVVVNDRFEIAAGRFYVARLREDGYREYGFAPVRLAWRMEDVLPSRSDLTNDAAEIQRTVAG